jgi:hypothetical protein
LKNKTIFYFDFDKKIPARIIEAIITQKRHERAWVAEATSSSNNFTTQNMFKNRLLLSNISIRK